MMKNIWQRALLGFPTGVFISYTITVLISLFGGRSDYSPVVPSLAESAGSEINAVLLQYLLSGLLGAGFAAGSLVWENERWSLLRRTATHLVISAGLLFPAAYLNHWMEHSLWGVLNYALVFIIFYALVWGAQWAFWMRNVRQINARLNQK